MNDQKYNAKQIELKWQKRWEESGIFNADNTSDKEKFYCLSMFPYPSGAGIHLGHVENYVGADIYSRFQKMRGFDVLQPIGWDAFGLPAENNAIKTGVHPDKNTHDNIANFTKQLKQLGIAYDWDREIDTSSPEYYKWTQWMFLLMYKNGLAYKKKAKVNWCNSCQTVLANEQAEGGKCERCKSSVVQKDLDQWFFKITDFIEDQECGDKKIKGLINGLDDIDWPESTKTAQKNWIGKSEGALIKFKVKSQKSIKSDDKLEVFTTRPDTLFGCTYMVVSPEHESITNFQLRITNYDEVKDYIEKSKNKSEIERADVTKEKTGVELKGIKAINPVDNEEIPIYVADYVLSGYGTGAIMAVPAHDERDYEFAKKYDIPIKQVISPPDGVYGVPKNISKEKIENVLETFKSKGYLFYHFDFDSYEFSCPDPKDNDIWLGKEFFSSISMEIPKCATSPASEWQYEKCYIGKGFLKNSGKFTGLFYNEAKEKMIEWLEKNNCGSKKVNYKLRDWLVSRQRYWGAPIPVIVCKHCKVNQLEIVNELSFYHQQSWENIINGSKTIESRALNPEEPERYFGSIKTGDLVKINNKNTDDFEIIKIKSIYKFKSLKELFDNKEVLVKIAPGYDLNNFDKLEEGYEELDKGYLNKIEQNGLIAWDFEILDTKEYIPVPEEDLPVVLPTDVDFKPTGESPLAQSKSFHDVKCPKCGKPARRESDTMDTFVCSAWYYLRFADPKNDKEFASKEKIKKWLPVDTYVGGTEHTVLHLLYARFFAKVLQKFGYVDFNEPFSKLRHQGIILGEDGNKMSKSLGNVVDPNEIIEEFGTDVLRMHVMFMGPFEEMKPWSSKGILGLKRFLDKTYNLKPITYSPKLTTQNSQFKTQNVEHTTTDELQKPLHKTIQKVTEDIENFKFNTAISSMMILVNILEKEKEVSTDVYEKLLLMIAPFAPHIAEELFQKLGNKESIFKQAWPEYNSELVKDDKIKLPIQINGKVRDIIEIDVDMPEDDIKSMALKSVKVRKWLENKEPKKVMYIKNRMVSIVM